MNRALLAAAAIAASSFALPSAASAQSFTAASLSASAGVRDFNFVGTRHAHGVRVHRGPDGRFPIRFANAGRDRFDHGRGYAYGYGDGYYEGDYDANRSFDPDRWNDWWHERPERSFPRWVWRNRDCTEDRMWWSGAGWRCTP